MIIWSWPPLCIQTYQCQQRHYQNQCSGAICFYTTQGQLIGNVSNKSIGGITAAMPGVFAEAKSIMGSGGAFSWARLFHWRRHSRHWPFLFWRPFRTVWNQTQKPDFQVVSRVLSTHFDLASQFYLNIVNGTPTLGLRNKYVSILEHEISVKKDTSN